MPNLPTKDYEFILKQTQLILNSYQHWTGNPLLSSCEDQENQVGILFNADFPVLSATADNDSILNYGNKAALELWEMNWETFRQTPSRLTAEPIERLQRQTFLDTVKRRGYVDDYEGIRISATGKRFKIEKAIVWNLIDPSGNYMGQAATFNQWTDLPNE